jgi:hypothetical protein
MVRRIRWSAVLATILVMGLAAVALAAVAYPDPRVAIPGNYAYNYSNSLDFTGDPGTAGFRLHDAWTTDGTEPAKAMYSKSANGTTWSNPKKVSGAQNAEGTSLAAAGQTIIVGWMTGYSYYDADGVPRRTQVNVSTDNGQTWKGATNLSAGTGHVDYPIVAAAQVGATTNVYAVWIDSDTCKVRFRQSSNGGTTWSAAITLGATSAHLSGAGYGCSGFPSIAATGDLISVVWVSADDGTMKVRSADNAGVAGASASLTGWKQAVTLTDKISVAQNGFPIASASPLADVVTIAYNTNAAQKFTTFDGGASATAAGTLIFTNGVVGPADYAGGYSTTVEPAPGGGYVAFWAGCRDVGLTNPCNYGSAKARFDLLTATSSGGAFSTPVRVEAASNTQQLNDEASVVVIPNGEGVKVFAQYNAYKSTYQYYDIWMQIGTGTL